MHAGGLSKKRDVFNILCKVVLINKIKTKKQLASFIFDFYL